MLLSQTSNDAYAQLLHLGWNSSQTVNASTATSYCFKSNCLGELAIPIEPGIPYLVQVRKYRHIHIHVCVHLCVLEDFGTFMI